MAETAVSGRSESEVSGRRRDADVAGRGEDGGGGMGRREVGAGEGGVSREGGRRKEAKGARGFW